MSYEHEIKKAILWYKGLGEFISLARKADKELSVLKEKYNLLREKSRELASSQEEGEYYYRCELGDEIESMITGVKLK